MEENKRYDRSEAWKYYINEKMMKAVMKKCAIMFVLGVALEVFSSYILSLYLSYNVEMANSYQESINNLTGTNISVLIIVAIGIITPLAEEIMYRGLLMSVCNLFLPFFVGNIIQAGVFAYSHGNTIQCIYAFLFGLLIGGLIKITGSFFYGIFLHIGVNIFGLFIDKYIPDETPFLLKTFYFIISIAVSAGCLYLLYKMRKKKTVS